MKGNDAEDKYGPEIVLETTAQFYSRKIKREGSYFFLYFAVPTYSFSFLNIYTSHNYFSFSKAFTEATLVLFTMTALYSLTVSYFCYIPKEKIEEMIKRDIEEYKFLCENNKKIERKNNNL